MQAMSFKVKLKIKLSLCFFLTKHHAMKAYWGVEDSSTYYLTSALDGGDWSASRPGRFTPRERAPGTHWIGGWVSPRAIMSFIIMQFSPRSIFLPFRSKYPPQHSVLRNPYSMFLPQSERPYSTTGKVTVMTNWDVEFLMKLTVM
jgi:hypothetical protein